MYSNVTGSIIKLLIDICIHKDCLFFLLILLLINLISFYKSICILCIFREKWIFIYLFLFFFLINIYYFILQFSTISNISQNKKTTRNSFFLNIYYFTLQLFYDDLSYNFTRVGNLFFNKHLSFCSTVIYTVHVQIFIWPRYNIHVLYFEEKKIIRNWEFYVIPPMII